MRLPASTSGNAEPHYAAKQFRIPEGGRNSTREGRAGAGGRRLASLQGREVIRRGGPDRGACRSIPELEPLRRFGAQRQNAEKDLVDIDNLPE